MPADLPAILAAIGNLLQVIIDRLGIGLTITIAVGLYVIFTLRRLYIDFRKDKDTDRAVKAMENSVQRSAQEARTWRILFMKEKAGWSLEDAERIVMETDIDDYSESPKDAEQKREKKKRKGRG